MESRKKAWLYRFTIGTLLFVMFLIAGLLSGYRIGFRYGNDARSTYYVDTYNVADLLTASQNVGSLMDVITTTISPNSWSDVGGEGSIQYVVTNQTLVVNQRNDVHSQIDLLLDQLRMSKP